MSSASVCNQRLVKARSEMLKQVQHDVFEKRGTTTLSTLITQKSVLLSNSKTHHPLSNIFTSILKLKLVSIWTKSNKKIVQKQTWFASKNSPTGKKWFSNWEKKIFQLRNNIFPTGHFRLSSCIFSEIWVCKEFWRHTDYVFDKRTLWAISCEFFRQKNIRT